MRPTAPPSCSVNQRAPSEPVTSSAGCEPAATDLFAICANGAVPLYARIVALLKPATHILPSGPTAKPKGFVPAGRAIGLKGTWFPVVSEMRSWLTLLMASQTLLPRGRMPTALLNGAPVENSTLAAPEGTDSLPNWPMFPDCPLVGSVYQTCASPAGPAAMAFGCGLFPTFGTGSSREAAQRGFAGSIRPSALLLNSVNQRAPSEPTVISLGSFENPARNPSAKVV